MALVNLYADRGPHAVVFHDAQGLAADAFLTQVARSLEKQFPNTQVEMTSHCLLDEPGSYRDVRMSGMSDMSTSVAHLGQPLAALQLVPRTGMGPDEIARVEETFRDLYRWTPTVSAAGLGQAVNTTDLKFGKVVDAHWEAKGVSGVILPNREGRSGVLIHDMDQHGSTHLLNAYLSHVVSNLAGPVVLAERSKGDPPVILSVKGKTAEKEMFCDVVRTNGQSTLPYHSLKTLTVDDVSDRTGIPVASLVEVVRTMRNLPAPPMCFSPMRPLDSTLEVTGQPLARAGVA